MLTNTVRRKEIVGTLLALVAIAALGAFFYYFSLGELREVKGATPPGIAGTVATTSVLVLDPNVAVPIFGVMGGGGVWNPYATSSTCASRIISSDGIAFRLQLRDGATATPSGGHLHAASTTVAYDSAIYGCGKWTAYPMVTDDRMATMTVTEVQ